MNGNERRKFVREGIARAREYAAEHPDGDSRDSVRFKIFAKMSWAEMIAYHVAVARQAGIDEVAFNEIVLTVAQLDQESLIEAADLLGKLGYRDVARMLRRLA